MSQGDASISSKPVEPVSADDSQTLGAAISRIQGKRVFSGHPADIVDDPETGEEGGGEESPPETAPPLPSHQEDKGDAQGEDQKADDASDNLDDWGFKPKYKTHRDAEIGYQEAERKMHEATQAAAAARAEIEQLRRELEELKAGRDQPPSIKEENPKEPQTNEQLVAAYEAALTEISALDPYDPNYHKLAAMAWAKTGLDKVLLNTALQELERRLDERLKAMQAPSTPQEPESGPTTAQTSDPQRLVAMAEEQAIKAGLDMTPGSLDHRLFWSNLQLLPEGMTLNDEISWMIKETKRLKSASGVGRPTPERIHSDNAVLERGGKTTSPPPEEKIPSTIGSLLDQQMQRRII